MRSSTGAGHLIPSPHLIFPSFQLNCVTSDFYLILFSLVSLLLLLFLLSRTWALKRVLQWDLNKQWRLVVCTRRPLEIAQETNVFLLSRLINEFRIRVDESGNLVFAKLLSSDEGRYQCLAQNVVATRETSSVLLSVHGNACLQSFM